MKAYELLAYLLEHTQPGSIVVVTTLDNVPIMIDKQDEYNIVAYVCKNEEVKKFRETFDKPTVHRAVIDLINNLSSYLQTQVDELNLANSVSFPDCVEKREARQREVKREKTKVAKPQKEDIKLLIEQMKALPNEFDVLPLLTKEGKLVSFVPQNLSLISFDKIVKTMSHVEGENLTPINPDLQVLNYVLSTVKFDLQKGNPFSSLNELTFFTAMFVDMGEIGEGEFLGRKMPKRNGKFFTSNSKGGLKPIPLEFLDYSKNRKNGLYVGYFVHDGQQFIRLGGYDLLEYHENGKFTINSYLFSSFIVTERDFTVDYQAFDRLVSNFVNSVISKGIGAKFVKEVFELENLIYDIQLVRAVSKEAINVVDPISFWYYKTKGQDVTLCTDCELKEKVSLWNRVIRNWFREFLL
ncbi:hypothetical protein [Stygiolobus caldivivus]|uniref:Uncharacterized protein n=1 Tax=Stygiolobus caldivivus TaxID=2824673 RepID=A0A8D5ZGK0_9CREN|nr:hypothetical protein [Stygiolobus caldivivus]BCU71008.1 hypothetical protein KN1_23050 [Stygiolobus caldivivus]